MNFFEAIILGIIQGLAEFLPISSSGHLLFFHELFGLSDPESSLAFDLLLHLGTLCAVFIVYYRDIWELIVSFFSLVKKLFSCKGNFKSLSLSHGERFVIMLFIALLPLIPAAILSDYVEAARNYLWILGICWIFNGGLLLLSDILAKKARNADSDKKSLLSALYVGCFQLFAILPGISRSGMTITGGLFNGYPREFAVKFSFILSIPAIIGANIFTLLKADGLSLELAPSVAGMLAALISGIGAIKLLDYISKKYTFKGFAYYTFIMGALTIIWSILR